MPPAAATPIPKTASATEEHQQVVGTVQSPLTLVGYDREQAARAGNKVVVEGEYEVLRDAHTGAELSRVPLNPDTGSDVGTLGTVVGNCGSSYIELYNQTSNDREGEFETGFNLVAGRRAIDFDWEIEITGPSHTYQWADHGPMHPSGTWTSLLRGFDVPVAGTQIGEVNPSLSRHTCSTEVSVHPVAPPTLSICHSKTNGCHRIFRSETM